MKFNERDLWKNIKSGDFLPVYLIKGSEEYLKQKYAKLIADSVVPAGLEAFNLHRLNGDDTDIEEIVIAAEALPAMCDHSCVLVHDFDFSSLSDTDRDALISFFKDAPDTCVMVLWQDTKAFPQKTKKQKELLKAVEKAGAVVDLDGRSHGDLIKYVMSECKKQERTIDYGTAAYLVDNVGDDMSRLNNEISKLCNYADALITEKAIDEICVKSLESTAFKMVDALMDNKFDSVFQSLSILFEQRTEPAMILGALISTYVDMYRAKVCMKAGEQPSYLKSCFPNAYKSDFKLKNAFRRCRKFSMESLRQSLEILAAADTKLKSTSEDARTIFEKLMVELAKVRKSC